MELYQKILELLTSGNSGVLVTLVAVEGSAPRTPGTKMLVSTGGILAGTIGGGGLEQEMVRLCFEVLASGESRLVTYTEDGDGGLACGGKVTAFLEPVIAGPRLIVVGCGHVGQALAGLADSCRWQVIVLDDRKQGCETAGQFYPLEDYDDPFAGLRVGKKDCLVIAGRSHGVDLQTLRAALATDAGFIGLLGSAKKKAAFFATLQKEGVGEEQLARTKTPVGLDIGARTPAEIAVSIMAQLIEHQRGI
jgi:xanthine dehydrogenase accessory factor